MEALIGKIEKAKPFFEKVSRNKYLKAIRDGFMSAMPVVLFSSIFMLIAYVPNIFNYYWPKEIEAMILKPYNYSMGLLAVLVAGTTATSAFFNLFIHCTIRNTTNAMIIKSIIPVINKP